MTEHTPLHQADTYIQKHSDADISHSIYPDCLQKYYPEEMESE
ncbi:hypothetical protein DESC_600117 [Desulfosarcina cetonica]|nr:hypothetical protein [Desulfosarcina cetonica]VTR67403.1 hypothetical protein DESC_600117 [Desulfosarcina cetonica]